MSDPIRVFVGCASGDDAESQAVLEWTLRKHMHGARGLSLNWMRQGAGFWKDWNTSSWATPFTGFRWGIPAFCGYEGRAIYCDSDVIFRADVAELWDQEMRGDVAILLKGTEGKLRTCVMLMDCAKLRPHLPPIKELKRLDDPNGWFRKYLDSHRELLGKFDGQWNCADLKHFSDVNDPDLKLIHYTLMATQPHLPRAKARLAKEGRRHWYDGETFPHARPELIELFEREFAEACANGYTPERYAAPHVDLRKKSWSHYKPPKERRG